MGILEASSGEQRYEILYEAHKKALEQGAQVDYSGIDTLRLTITKGAKSIPLGSTTDFKGTVFIVHSEDRGNFYLFTMSGSAKPVTIEDISLFENGDFRSIPMLRSKHKLLIIEDQNPWIDKRRGFSYGTNRRDILLLNNGRAQNSTIATYSNVYSKPVCTYVTIDKKRKVFSNIEFQRTATSTSKTFLVKFENEFNINVQNIKLFTPQGTGLYGDVAIKFINCARVVVDNVSINGTYSLLDNYGYGISMDNVYDSDFNHIEGAAQWGVFGNNFVNKSILRNSHVNRYDVHCYGRDITMENCLFDDSGFIYSSIFGQVVFKKCVFKNVFPCLNRLDFNAYTPFEILFENCVFEFDEKHYALVNLSDVDDIINPRNELSKKYLPNVSVVNCSFNLLPNAKYLNVFYVGACKYPHPIKGLSQISLSNIKVTGLEIPLSISNTYFETEEAVSVNLDHISYNTHGRIIEDYPFIKVTTLNKNDLSKRVINGRKFVKN